VLDADFISVSPNNTPLNLNTGFISDQYHCVHDDLFSSVPCPIGNPFDPETFSQPSWAKIIESGYERHVPIDYNHLGRPIPLPPLSDEWLSGPQRLLRTQIRRQRSERRHLQRHQTPTLQRELDPTLQRELPPQQLHPMLLGEPHPIRRGSSIRQYPISYSLAGSDKLSRRIHHNTVVAIHRLKVATLHPGPLSTLETLIAARMTILTTKQTIKHKT
jgi:hypothetical protein